MIKSIYFNPDIVSDRVKEDILHKINENSEIQDDSGCIHWTKSTSSAGYPHMKLGKPLNTIFKDKPYNPGHLKYNFAKHIILNWNTFHMSHRCHNKICINVDHLSYEPASVNKSRDFCKMAKACSENHGFEGEKYRNCILLW